MLRSWPALPALVCVVGLLFVPLAFMTAYSTSSIALFPGDTVGVEWTYWQRAFAPDSPYLRALLTTLVLSTAVTVAVVLLAMPLAYFLALCVHRRRYGLLFLLIAPFLTSYLLRVLAWKVVLGDQGLVNAAVQAVGLRPDGSPVPGLLYSPVAVVLVLVHSWLPFAVLPIFASLVATDTTLLDAALDLGATRTQALLRVTLPLATPGVTASAVAVFVPTLGEFVTPNLVGGVGTYLYGNGISSLFGPSLDWKTGSVLSVVLFAVAVVGLAVLARTRSLQAVAR